MRPRSLALAAGLLAAAAACSSGAAPDGEQRHRVRAVVSPYLNMMPFHIAAEEGYFEQQGLDVEFVRVGRTQEIMAALASGDIDAAGGMLTVNELNLAIQGARVRLVADLGRLSRDACTFNAVVVRREHVESGAIEDAERVREMVLDADLLIPFGYWMDELLAPLGLTTADLETVNLSSPAAIEAFAQGAIDITLESEPFLTRYRRMPEAAIWRPVEELAPDYSIAVVMYGPSLLDERPEAGERFATAMLRAMRRYNEGKTEDNLRIVEAASGLDRSLLEDACWPVLPDNGRLDAAVFRGYQQWNLDRGYIDRMVGEDELFDHRFIDHANRELSR